MRKKLNYWWLIAPLAVAAVLWLAQPKTSVAPTGRMPAAPATAAGIAPGSRVAEAGTRLDEVATPRHPEIGFRNRERLMQHFKKHGREFHVRDAQEFLRLAQALRDRPRGGSVLEMVRNDAVTCKFDRSDGSFVAYNSDGTIRTFFRPRDGEAYFERQRTRAGDVP